MNKGYIALYRAFQQNILYSEKPFDKRSAWIDILLTVNWKDNTILVDGQPKLIKRGQTLTSELGLAERWGWSTTKVRNFLKLLEKESMISVEKKARKYTVLTVEKYDFYQRGEAEEKAQEKHRESTEKVQEKHRKSTGKAQENINNKENKGNQENQGKKEKTLLLERAREPSDEFVDEVLDFFNLSAKTAQKKTAIVKSRIQNLEKKGYTVADINSVIKDASIESQKAGTTPNLLQVLGVTFPERLKSVQARDGAK